MDLVAISGRKSEGSTVRDRAQGRQSARLRIRRRLVRPASRGRFRQSCLCLLLRGCEMTSENGGPAISDSPLGIEDLRDVQPRVGPILNAPAGTQERFSPMWFPASRQVAIDSATPRHDVAIARDMAMPSKAAAVSLAVCLWLPRHSSQSKRNDHCADELICVLPNTPPVLCEGALHCVL